MNSFTHRDVGNTAAETPATPRGDTLHGHSYQSQLRRRDWLWVCAGVALGMAGATAPSVFGQQPTPPRPGGAGSQAKTELRRLSPTDEVWLDLKHKRVIVGGEIVLREGTLELFACLKGTKEHEAIVACATRAHVVHAGLLALGIEPGHPVAFRPEYQAAAGPRIEVNVHWKENGAPKQARAQQWIRGVQDKQQLEQPWVFGGSGFWEDPNSKEQHYMAEDGDFICVSNFPSAMLDLPIESSQSNEALAYECFTERIPPVGTKVTLTLRVNPAAKPADATAKPADAAKPTEAGAKPPESGASQP
ncbi:MAG: YdjY domain-containing protein [Pirellulales bacterium]|nr:YdjY domain-containing protein [Pirellulales bacterium]